jgi:transcriptional regulator
MHAAPNFRMDDVSEMAALIEARRFGTLVVATPEGPVAAHIPMIVVRDAAGQPVGIEGHVARNNPMGTLTATPQRALAIFHGADAYVSPSLYLAKREHGKVVPTWNYVAIEVRGVVQAFSDAPGMRDLVSRLTDVMEQPTAAPWAVSDAPEDYIQKMLNGITGLRMTVESIEGSRKLSQNRAEGDRLSVQNAFAHSPDPAARELANEMSKKV